MFLLQTGLRHSKEIEKGNTVLESTSDGESVSNGGKEIVIMFKSLIIIKEAS